MKYFVILSEGSYSDYSPTYFMGDIKITQKELDKRGKEIGDIVLEWYKKLPERVEENGYKLNDNGMEKYNTETKETIYSSDMEEKWTTRMKIWLKVDKKYKELSDNIPEININYDDIPHN